MDNNYSLSDIRAATSNGGMFGEDGSSWWLLILFFLFAGGGNWGMNRAALDRADLCEGFNFQNIENGIRGIQQGLCDGFYAQNTTMLQGFNGLGHQIAENRFAAQQCCCETNRNIDGVKAEAYKNTCDITTAIHAEGEQTRALINANTMQALRDKLADRDRDLLTANFQLSQQAQNATLINELRPCARPAYLTCSPYESNAFNSSRGCGFNNGCSCA